MVDPYVHPAVQDVLNDPAPGATVTLAVVVSSSGDAVREYVEGHEGSVTRELPSGVLLVNLPETEIESLCHLDGVESVSPDEQMEIMG